MQKIGSIPDEMKQLNLRMPAELIHKLKLLAVERNVTMALYIQRILVRHVMENKEYVK